MIAVEVAGVLKEEECVVVVVVVVVVAAAAVVVVVASLDIYVIDSSMAKKCSTLLLTLNDAPSHKMDLY